jgi:hypothetical protein
MTDTRVFVKFDTSFVDITSKVKSVSVDRGKPYDTDQTVAGKAFVLLDNQDRTFDPFNNLSPYYEQIIPKKEIKITTDGVEIFTGLIDTWNLRYNLSGLSEAEIDATDVFTLLAQAILNNIQNQSESPQQRINKILSLPEVSFPEDKRELSTGTVFLQGDNITNATNVLNYLQVINETEAGALFIDKQGSLIFENRGTFGDYFNRLLFTDDNLGIPYSNIDVAYGVDNLYNRISISNLNQEENAETVTVIANDFLSQVSSGIYTLSYADLLLTSEQFAKNLADYYLIKYRNPKVRIKFISVNFNALDDSQKADVLALELNDLIEVNFTPNNVGQPIVQLGKVIGLKHDIEITEHNLTIELDSFENNVFILDDLDNGRLAFFEPDYDDSETLYDEKSVAYDATLSFGYILV